MKAGTGFIDAQILPTHPRKSIPAHVHQSPRQRNTGYIPTMMGNKKVTAPLRKTEKSEDHEK